MGEDKASPTPVAPAMALFGAAGILSFGFGAGYGARSYSSSAAFKDLIEKFPDKPTPEAEALARGGATRALALGTALAGAMGVGAVLMARSYGINSAADLGEEIQKWLPTKSQLEDKLQPTIEPLQRTISENLQGARNRAGEKFAGSEVGKALLEKANKSAASRPPPAEWEKELVSKLEGTTK